jgi:hypothetical protein
LFYRHNIAVGISYTAAIFDHQQTMGFRTSTGRVSIHLQLKPRFFETCH